MNEMGRNKYVILNNEANLIMLPLFNEITGTEIILIKLKILLDNT